MKRKLEQIKNGRFQYQLPKLILSQEELLLEVNPGEKLQGDFYFGAENEQKITGFVATTNRRFVPSVERFSGTAIQFAYGIDGEGMAPGDECNGVMHLITSVGEYEVPYSIKAKREQVHTSIGEVSDLNEFVKLAQDNFREAFRLFTDKAFPVLLEKDKDRLVPLYQGVSHNPITYQHLEEFLIGAGLKEPVEISIGERENEFYDIQESTKDTLTIRRSGWGYFQLEIEAQGDFIELQRRTVSQDDFIGSSYQLEFVILSQKLTRGRHFGKVLIKTPYEMLEYQVMASRNSDFSLNMGVFEKKRKGELFHNFIQLQLHKLDFKSWMDHAKKLLKEMREAGCDYPVYQIYEAYVLHQDDQDQAANEILLKYQDKSFTRDEIELAGAYLYTCYETGLLSDRWALVERLQQLYRQKPDSSILLWILMAVDEEYKGSPIRAAGALEEQYLAGCRSPLIYLKALEQVNKDLNLMSRMTSFWTQVILFGAKEGLLNEEICMHVAYLSGYEKDFSPSLYRALTLSYEQFPGTDTLEAICKLIMKDNPGQKKYFPWLSLAVEQNIRLTRLYECYMDSIDERYQKILPKTIRIYFAYNNKLSDRQKAFVYANVVRHKEEDLSVYGNYKSTIHDFALKKLQEGAISEDYAVLYREVLKDLKEVEELRAFGKIVFAYRLFCDDKRIRNVIVRHGQLKEEEVYPCVKGVAYPLIYRQDAVILFEDSRKQRYVATVDYNLRPLFDEEAVEYCSRQEAPDKGLLLYLCGEKLTGGKVSEQNLEAHRSLVNCTEFTNDYRRQIRKRLLGFYEENSRGEDIDDYLRGLNYRQFALVDKVQLMELLIERGMLREAYGILGEFGYEGVSVQALLKMCRRMILQCEFEEDEELICLAADIFSQDLYDEVLLHYLMLYYTGPVASMTRLWECARGFQLDTYQLEEKILTQLVYVEDSSSSGVRILENYIKQKGQEETIMAYLTFRSYGYMVHSCDFPQFIQRCLGVAYEHDRKMDIICKAALLKAYSLQKDWSSVQQRQAEQLLEECYKKKLRFSFYRNLPDKMLSPYQLDDKVYVEYHGNPDSEVILHYSLDMGLGNETEYKSEPLRNMYQGYFNKMFTLFYGESLHYYFQVENGDDKMTTPEKVLTASSVKEQSQSRYQMINQMLAARKLGRQDMVREKMQQYQLQEKYVEKLFSIEKEQAYE